MQVRERKGCVSLALDPKRVAGWAVAIGRMATQRARLQAWKEGILFKKTEGETI